MKKHNYHPQQNTRIYFFNPRNTIFSEALLCKVFLYNLTIIEIDNNLLIFYFKKSKVQKVLNGIKQ